MKNISELFTVLLSLVVLSCNKEELLLKIDNQEKGYIEIKAIACVNPICPSNTKVTFNEGNKLIWENNDEIGVKVKSNISKLKLVSIENGRGIFSGTLSAIGDSMSIYYPSTVAQNAVDLTVQSGATIKDVAKNVVMFAKTKFSESPSFNFNNKVSILQLNIPAPLDINSKVALELTVHGAYSKGFLDESGNWKDTEVSAIKIKGAKIEDGVIKGYVAVLPESKVANLRISVTDGSKAYVSLNYTAKNAIIPENKIITIKQKVELLPAWRFAEYNMKNATTMATSDNIPIGYNVASQKNLTYYFDWNTSIDNWSKGKSQYKVDGFEYYLPSQDEWRSIFADFKGGNNIQFNKSISVTSTTEKISYGNVTKEYKATYWNSKLLNGKYDAYSIKLYTDTDYGASCAYRYKWYNYGDKINAYLEVTVVYLGSDAEHYLKDITNKKSEVEELLNKVSMSNRIYRVLKFSASGYISEGNTTVSDVGSFGDYWTSTEDDAEYSCDIYFTRVTVNIEDYINKTKAFSIRLIR